MINRIIEFLFGNKEFPYDNILICKYQYKNKTYEKKFIDKFTKKLYGVEIGSHQSEKKQGDYKKTFYHLYLDEDLPEILLWDISIEIKKSIIIEESGTYIDNQKQGPCTILYRDSTSQKIICQEECEFKDNIKIGKFSRTYNLDHKKQHMKENGIHFNNCESKSTIVTYDQQDRQISINDITKKQYISHRKYCTIDRCKKIICKYSIQTENRIQEGEYCYNLQDNKFNVLCSYNCVRTGDYTFKNLSQNYKTIGFLPHNKKKGILSPDEKYIILENVSNRFDKTVTKLIFEKELLMNSVLFDNESFCFVANIFIGLTYYNSRSYEPIYQTFLYDENKKQSLLRLLFNKKHFKGKIIFKNGDRNLITKENVLFVSNANFLKMENHEELTTLQQNPNFI